MPDKATGDGLILEPRFQDDLRWTAVLEIGRSEVFARSPRMWQTLQYLAEQTIKGRGEQISEAELAVNVFERDAGFDPAEDTIVRTQLARLRMRLLQEGRAAGYLITLPKGQYCLEFQAVETTSAGMDEQYDPLPSTDAPLEVHSGAGRSRRAALLIVIVAVALTVPLLYVMHRRATVSASEMLWRNIFSPARPTMFIAADDSLVLINRLLHHPTILKDYTTGRYLDEVRTLHRNGIETLGIEYGMSTAMASVGMANELTLLSMQHNGTLKVRHASNVSVEDLRRQNVVISGSICSNPWMELYQPSLNFRIGDDQHRCTNQVVNLAPQAHEKAVYAWTPETPRDYGVLAFLPGLGVGSDVLILEGTTIAGTSAMSDLAFDPKQLNSVIQVFRNSHGMLQRFEILFSVEDVNGSAGNFQILASRTHP